MHVEEEREVEGRRKNRRGEVKEEEKEEKKRRIRGQDNRRRSLAPRASVGGWRAGTLPWQTFALSRTRNAKSATALAAHIRRSEACTGGGGGMKRNKNISKTLKKSLRVQRKRARIREQLRRRARGAYLRGAAMLARGVERRGGKRESKKTKIENLKKDRLPYFFVRHPRAARHPAGRKIKKILQNR
jgi:hypothetical protein